jgi:arabinan endo-1,5-alpha-L-arabinosidase
VLVGARFRERWRLAHRVAGVATMAVLACSTGCLPDPNRDPCRGLAHPGACVADAASARDSGQEAGAGEQADAGPPADVDAHAEPRMDAGQEPDLDGAVAALEAGTDAAMDTAVDPDEDAAAPDAGEEGVPKVLALEGDLGVHDPTIIEVDGTFTIFSTGAGVRVKRSSDLLTWQDSGRVFATNPAWIAQEVPGATDLWAPDIAYYGGQYHLYYSASTFGSRNSCIGHATASDLTVLNFVDQGPVICTEQTDDYNAIDPGFIVDASGTAWLSFGSFWSGIKLVRLDAEGQRDGTEMHSLASRDAVEAIEAPSLVRRGDYYYLFVSFDLCCRGTASTYRIMVGRSANVTGPYLDAEGKPMLAVGGGSSVVLGNQRWRGPGHNALLTVGEHQYLVYHAYDAERGGAPTLRIAELLWDSTGWPVKAGP